jgi:hypothetical protein
MSESDLLGMCHRIENYWPGLVRVRSLTLIATFLRGQSIFEEINKIGVSEDEFTLVYTLVAKNIKTLKVNIKIVSLTLKRLNSLRD